MLTLRRPQSDLKRRFLHSQAKLAVTYAELGATATIPPSDYMIDHTRVALGEGEAVFASGRRALERWDQFRLGWLDAWPPDTRIQVGETALVIARVFGLWSLNAARIVYVIDELTASISRFGFAYGTLPGHVETGEERFLIEWDKSNNRVWYDILAFSRPRHWLTRLGRRQARRLQRRFARESAAAMQRTVQSTSEIGPPR